MSSSAGPVTGDIPHTREAGAKPFAAGDGGVQRSTSWLYLLAGCLFIALTLVGAAMMTFMLRQAALAQGVQSVAQIATAAAEQVSRTTESIDGTLQDIAHQLDTSAARAGVDPLSLLASAELNRVLIAHLEQHPDLAALSVMDSRGVLVNSTRGPPYALTAADREFFSVLQRQLASGLAISGPVRSHYDGSWIAVIARRMSLGSPEVDGVVLGVLRLDRLGQSLAGLAHEKGTTVTLRRGDTVLARVPWLDAAIGSPSAAHDDGDRLAVSRVLRDSALRIEVSMTKAAALAMWRRQSFAIAIFALSIACCIAFMLTVLAQQFRAQRDVRLALARQHGELADAHEHLEHRTRELADTAEALRAGETLLAERSEALSTTLQHIDQGIMMVDASGRVAVYNHHVVDMLGIPEELLAKRPLFSEVLQFQFDTDEFSRNEQSFIDFVRAGGIDDGPQVYQRERPSGQVIEVHSVPLPQGGIVRTYTDITERKQAQLRIEHAALFDELTGLPNRLSVRQSLQRRLDGEPEGGRTALLYLNLDRFRLLNDARGHETADQFLLEVGRRLTALLPLGDVAGRVGGDEFAVIHGMTEGVDDSPALSDRLLHMLGEAHVINDVRLAVTVSIGVAVAAPGANAENLLRNADIALYRAKDAGRNKVCRYEPAMAEAQRERFQLEQSLREALGTEAFRLVYQPIISLETDAIVGYEALLRWTDRVRGEVSPGLFIPVAEATGLIVPLGRSVLEWACFEAASWNNSRTVAVNLSPAQFQDGDLRQTVAEILRRSGLAPHRLELEVTEGMLLDDSGPVLETMMALRALGVRLTLDDFGTGHAGLSYLRRFPFQKLKIDRSFISNIGRDRESDAIVEATLLLSKRLDLGVVAEGVEQEAQLEQLRRLHCPFVQGYLTGRPVPPEIARGL